MTRKSIAIILGVALGVMAAALVLVGVLHGLDGKAQAQPGPYPPTDQYPTWSIQDGGPLSISAGGPFNPADILQNPGAPAVCIPCRNLGLVGCSPPFPPPPGAWDELDALTYGADFGAYDSSQGYLGFSVDVGSSGQPATAVNVEANCTPAEPEADEFTTQLDGNNFQFFDGNGVACGTNAGANLGLIEPLGDDLDAIDNKSCQEVDPEGDGYPNRYVYFSLAPGSPTLGLIPASPADVLVTIGGGLPWIYATQAQLGLGAGDDVNGLCLADTAMDDYFDPIGASGFPDYLFYTVTAASPSIVNGLVPNAATIMYVPMPGVAIPVDTATALGLLEDNTDDVDAIKCVKGLVDISIEEYTIDLPDGGTAPPATQVTLPIGEWSDFNMYELKQYTGVNEELSPPSVTSQVGWAVIGYYPGQLSVRFNAQAGDICTDQNGAPVPCGEGGTAGVPWDPQSLPVPPPAGVDSCKDGLDNDQDGLTDFNDPDCVDIYDAHFQVNLPWGAGVPVNREVQFRCEVEGDFEVTFENTELPLGADDISGGNNAGYIDLTIICEQAVAVADKDVIDIEFRDATGLPIDPPEMEILKSQDYTISVTSVEFNNGPDQPLDAEISFYANVPAGCEGQWVLDPANYADILTVDGDPAVPSSGTVTVPGMVDGLRTVDLHFQTLEYGFDEPPQSTLTFTRDFELHCSDAPDVPYEFTFCNRADVKPPDTDPDPTNNLWCEDLWVTSLHNADIKVLSWSAPSPQSGEVGAPFQITVDEDKHNNGPQAAWSDVTWTAQEPAGGQVSARWIPQAGDSQPSDEVLQFQVDLSAISTTLSLSRNLELTCNTAGGPYTVTLINDEWPINPNPPHDPWEDPVPGNNSATTNVLVNCTSGAQEVKWAQLPDGSPNGLDVDATQPYILSDDFQCTESGMITEIDFWASWLYDELPGGDPNNVAFTLSLHSDVPMGVDLPWSHPGDVLWLHTFGPGECVAQPWGPGEEGWLEPPDMYLPFADTMMWFYTCPIPPADWYQQEEGTIYWLDIQATPLFSAYFGWKTSVDHWNDDGVWAMGAEPIPAPMWNELRYPAGHPLFPMSIDLAFQIQGQPCTAGVDTDGDTFNDDVECYLPTDSKDNCTNNPGVHDAWPLDINIDKNITVVGDVLPYSGRMGSTGGPPPSANWRQRLDINMDNFLTVVGDVLKFSGKIGSKCT
jgi:hypothetical protein